jgi:two-component system, NtrC family, sensor kinase
MKKIFLLSACFLFASTIGFSQTSKPDSLRLLLSKTENDTARFQLYEQLYNFYSFKQMDSALYYATKRVELIQKYHQPLAEAYALNGQGYYLYRQGNYYAAMRCFLNAIKISEDSKTEKSNAFLPPGTDVEQYRLRNLNLAHMDMGHIMGETGNEEQQLVQYRQAEKLAEQNKDTDLNITVKGSIAAIAMNNDQFDAAFSILDSAKHMISDSYKYDLPYINFLEGTAWFLKGDIEKAKDDFYKAIQKGDNYIDLDTRVRAYFGLSDLYILQKQKDSSLAYATRSINDLNELGNLNSHGNTISKAYENLYKAYMLNNKPDSVLKYLQLTLYTKDSLDKAKFDNLAKLQALTLQEQFRLQEIAKEKVINENRIRTYSLLSGLVVLLIVGFILYRNNRQKQKANKVLETTLTNLKSTQSQLIQSEKMASLGELTAGIAHEIQNPLNFVNNFSEVSNELLDEMKSELEKGDVDEAKVIAGDVKQNLEKILHHGKRADTIVKGMLQHTGTSSGQKEPTDINALCDEYLRLAFHGLKAKEKTFNSEYKTDFDNSIEKINVVAQDIGRVVLNLINNAFYAVNEKGKQNIAGYDPTVTVSTKRINGKIEISVKDNGNGIPESIKEKIFQPFFTTKPTGQGTGLGLSLSYDIVKAHGGDIKIASKEGEGSEFIIQLS